MDGLLMRYFVLKPSGQSPYARASRMAMRKYADAIKGENPDLARELGEWADRTHAEAWGTSQAD